MTCIKKYPEQTQGKVTSDKGGVENGSYEHKTGRGTKECMSDLCHKREECDTKS